MSGRTRERLGHLRGRLRTTKFALQLVLDADRVLFFWIVSLTIVTSMATAGVLLVGRRLLNLLEANDTVSTSDLATDLAMLGALLIVSAMSQALTDELRIPLGSTLSQRVAEELLEIATAVDVETYETSDFYNRIQLARIGSGERSSSIVFGIVNIISTALISLGIAFVLITVSPVLVPISILGSIPVMWVHVRNNQLRHQLERDMVELERERSYLEYVLTERNDVKEVRSFRTAPLMRSFHRRLWQQRHEALRAIVRKRIRMTTFGTAITTAVLIGTLGFVLVLAGRGSITIGDAAVAVVGLQQLSGRLRTIGGSFSVVHEGVTFLREFEQLRDALPDIAEKRPSGVPPSPPTVLTVESVSYRYPGSERDVLCNVSFELKRGQTLAIVGANGSGKSTLAKVLSGLIAPSTGSVSWDGVDLATCDPELVRRNIAPVFQDYSQIYLTVRQVIGLGDVDRMDDEQGILEALRYVGLDDVVQSLPNGLDSRLGKFFTGGIDLSIGQWQRTAIARALFRDAPFVVMDEPSASLDPQAEEELFGFLQARAERTMLIYISHRFATVKSADLVIVMDGGEVVERGPHEQLMEANGLYADMFRLQAARFGTISDLQRAKDG